VLEPLTAVGKGAVFFLEAIGSLVAVGASPSIDLEDLELGGMMIGASLSASSQQREDLSCRTALARLQLVAGLGDRLLQTLLFLLVQ
jgi:hypothetical protein